jgi:hypothetical protein
MGKSEQLSGTRPTIAPKQLTRPAPRAVGVDDLFGILNLLLAAFDA